MRIKNSKAIIGLFLIFIMFGSSIAYAAIQPVLQPTTQEQIEVPQIGTIQNKELTQSQENLLLSRGVTILKFSYNPSCTDCMGNKTFVESILGSSEFGNQVILVETASDSSTKLEIVSFYGQKTITNLYQDDIVGALCELVAMPPYQCALSKG